MARLNVDLEDGLYKNLKLDAVENGVTITDIVTQMLIERYVQGDPVIVPKKEDRIHLALPEPKENQWMPCKHGSKPTLCKHGCT